MPKLEVILEFLPLGILFLLPWLVYSDALTCGWVSDDIQGIQQYDGALQRPISWHNLFKKLRWEFGKVTNPNQKWKEEKQRAFVPSSSAHHRLNIWLACGVSVLLYSFLSRIFSPTIAFAATFLFLVHPLGCQIIAWISGIGYLTGLLFMLAGFNTGFLLYDWNWMSTAMGTIAAITIYGFFQWMAVEAMFSTVGAVAILCWLHWWPFAIVAAALGFLQCFHTLKDAVMLRRKVFHEQQMGQSTRFYPRKLVVMIKTFAYNLKLAWFPKRLGLYHTYCYHYTLPYVESEDIYFWSGLLLLIGAIIGVLWGPPLVQLAILWFIAFNILFSNAITANQFVVDRYVWIPSLGACLIVAAYAPLWLFWLIAGIALMRTWSHIPTYTNEIQFYLSNLWNFPNSEVAAGNLGVVYMGKGFIGSALDAWTLGTQINPDYDVPWYNLASMIRSRGPINPNYAPILFSAVPGEIMNYAINTDPNRFHLHVSRYFLSQAVKAKTCHFPDPWKREMEQIDAELLNKVKEVTTATLVRPMILEAVT